MRYDVAVTQRRYDVVLFHAPIVQICKLNRNVMYLGDTRSEFRNVGGASKISVCFSGNISVSHN